MHVVVDAGDAETIAAQHAAWMAVNLIARMAEDVVGLAISAPDGVKLHDHVIPWTSSTGLAEALVEGADRVGIVPVSAHDTDTATFTIIIGTGAVARGDLHAAGDGWTGSISKQPLPTTPGASSLPVGPYVAACLAARAVFARARTHWDDFNHTYSAWTHSSNTEIADDEPCELDLELGEVLIAGAGAVGTALMHTLWATRGISGLVTVADGDEKGIEASNLNRCPLFRLDMVGHRKASTAVQVVDGDSPLRWDKHDGRATDIGRFPALVISAVDSNTSRAEIQSRYPSILLSGSTRDLRAEILRCGPPGAGACLSCFNAPEEQTSDDQLRSLLRETADIETLAQEAGASTTDLTSWAENGGCGRLSQESLRRLRGRLSSAPDDGDWAVGFVSVFVGVSLAAEVLKERMAVTAPLNSRLQRSSIQFARLSERPESHAGPYLRQRTCPRCAPGIAVDTWRQRYVHRGSAD